MATLSGREWKEKGNVPLKAVRLKEEGDSLASGLGSLAGNFNACPIARPRQSRQYGLPFLSIWSPYKAHLVGSSQVS